MKKAPPYRIGQGYDCHALVPGRPRIIGGVNIPTRLGLLGHSQSLITICRFRPVTRGRDMDLRVT